MIIRHDDHRLLLITQPDHAALSRQVMTEWRTRGFPSHPRRDSLLHAIDQHDNGWREVDAAPIVGDGGALLDFISAPVDVRQGIWPRGVRRLSADPIAAALVAEHALYIYRRYADDPAWRDFFVDMQILRDEHAAGAGLTARALARDYFFLRIADLISLVFCNRWTEPQDLDDHLVWLDGDAVIVQPDPFGGRQVAIEIAARAIPPRTYASSEDARIAYGAAEHVSVRGLVRGR